MANRSEFLRQKAMAAYGPGSGSSPKPTPVYLSKAVWELAVALLGFLADFVAGMRWDISTKVMRTLVEILSAPAPFSESILA